MNEEEKEWDEVEPDEVVIDDELDEDDIDPQRVVDRENSKAIDFNNRDNK